MLKVHCVVCCVQCTLCNILCIVNCIYTVGWASGSLFNRRQQVAEGTICSVQCTVYSVFCRLTIRAILLNDHKMFEVFKIELCAEYKVYSVQCKAITTTRSITVYTCLPLITHLSFKAAMKNTSEICSLHVKKSMACEMTALRLVKIDKSSSRPAYD